MNKVRSLSAVSLGYGGMAIIVNASTGINRLTVDEVKKLLTGEFSTWKQAGGTDGPVQVVRTGEGHPGTLDFMQNDFLKKPFTSKAIVADTFPSVVSKVADTPGAIGFVRIREITESPVVRNNPRLKVVAISRIESTVPVMPSRDTVADRSYPIPRPYVLYYIPTVEPEAVKFADYVVKRGWGPQHQ